MNSRYLLPVLLLSLLMLTVFACSETASETETLQPLSESESHLYRDQGVVIIAETQSALSSNLMAKMQSGGVPAAVPFCNVKAYPLTDSMATLHGVKIRRTALRTRNPQNNPTDTEKTYLDQFNQQIQAGEMPMPQVEAVSNQEVAFYAPIVLNALCTKCHGDLETEIGTENYALIQSLYPDDQATGFKDQELRGMWSLILPRDKEVPTNEN